MRCTINTTAMNQIRDRQDRTNVAGVDVLAMHLTHARLRLHARRACESLVALAGGKRAPKQAFTGTAIPTAKLMGSVEPKCSVGGESYRRWRCPRAASSPAWATIALS